MEQIVSLLPMILIIVVFYFLLIRPQKKKEKETQAMINAVKVGDEILTIGGIHGKISKIKDDNITILSSTQKTSIEISRWAIKDVTKYVEDIKEEPNAKADTPAKADAPAEAE